MEELHPSKHHAEKRIASDSVLAPDVNLWEPTTLLVKFMEEIQEKNQSKLKMSIPSTSEDATVLQPCKEKWGLTTEQILQWANKWSTTPKSCAQENFIPKFELAKDNDKPHIVVVLNERGENFTQYGEHQASIDEPSMLLDLSNGDDCHKQHLVVHEFGHALGLGHEHQRPDFWKLIGPYVDKSRMESEIEDMGAFCCDWKMDKGLKVKNERATSYDSESVMHYWFVKEWLTNGYHDKNKIEEDYRCKVLTKEKRDALMAVHDCDRKEAIVPSAKDLEFLNKKYHRKTQSTMSCICK